jgi:succinate-semialdehyde dehydrogenase/glutarate-semialdehyde dehydrogenase
MPLPLNNAAYIGGKWISNSISGKIFSVINPANGETIGSLPYMEAEETKTAIYAAHTALPGWRSLLSKERSKYIRHMADILSAKKEEVARIMVTEQGKILSEARAEVGSSIAYLEWFAEEAKRIYGDILPSARPNQRLFTTREPIGVVAAITPWNFPASIIMRKLAPALGSGCTIVIKPSEETPYTALAIAQIAEEAGIPAGVINIVFGDAQKIGQELTSSSKVRMLTFTGSTRVGKLLMAQCASTVKKVTLELGGNAPLIVFNDADIKKAIAGLISSKLRNAGQTCICPNRIYIQQDILNEFTQELKIELDKIKIGDGMDGTSTMGPLINELAIKKVDDLIKDSCEHQGEILYQSSFKTPNPNGFFNPIMILKNKQNNTLIEQTEIFGPVFSLFTFFTEEEAIIKANATNYGLSSYFYTNNKDRIWRVAEKLEYGMVGVNDVILSSETASFGGIKESGIGREGGKHGIMEYLEDKYIAMGSG